ncbi:MAG: 50S ribosomal protein L6 [Candidatus Paceibacteria bacterium]
MSRIGNQTIEYSDKVDITVESDTLKVSGPNGELQRDLPAEVSVNINEEEGEANVEVENPEENRQKSLWGTFASHLSNMVEGVTDGFKKELEINGVGYRVKEKGTDIELEVGFAEPVVYDIPSSIDASVEGNKITIESADKELVGKVAAEIRNVRPPEPYKGKGIKYVDEDIRRKEGKTASEEVGPGA